MKLKQLFFVLLVALGFFSSAQESNKTVLFSINDKPYYTDEFSRIYKKNIDLVKDDSQKDLDQYLELFIGYKLKINKAYELGLQKGINYQSELKSYRTQLAKNYLTDSKVTKALVEEGYNRSLKEIKAAHILIMVDENATPADTLKAFNEITAIYKRAIAGEDFLSLAETYSQDPSAKENKGDLGYFSAFRMVYAFENGAYKTKVGTVSNPIRTRFGYHLIKVNAIRDNRGEVTVAHILIMKPEDGSVSDKAKTTIHDIYKKLQQGENFETLAAQFSEDQSTASKAGVLNRFGSGQLSSDTFENTAFLLTKENPIAAPFETQYGWHIVKLIDKHPVKSFEEMLPELESKIKTDDRSRLIAISMNEKLRNQYPVKRNNKLYNLLSQTVTKDFYTNSWKKPEINAPYDIPLFKIKERVLSGSDFLTYLERQQKTAKDSKKPLNQIITGCYEQFLDEELVRYHDDNLEKQFPEFGHIVEEYRDGLLLFDLMEKEIWEKSKNDTIGLQKFYDTHKDNYMWKNRVDGVIASSTKEDVVQRARKMLQDNNTIAFIKAQLNNEESVAIMDKEGTFEEDNVVLPRSIKLETGISPVVKEGDYYYVAKINKVLPAAVKTLTECKGKVINDYQQYLEENWVNDLKKTFKVTLNQAAFEKVKKEIKI